MNFRSVNHLIRKKAILLFANPKHIRIPEDDAKRKLTSRPAKFPFEGCASAKLGREKDMKYRQQRILPTRASKRIPQMVTVQLV